MIYRITGRQRCKWAATNGNYPEMVICPDIFQNSPLTIRSNITTTLLHPTAPIVWLRRCTAQMVRQALSNFSRSTNPPLRKRGGLHLQTASEFTSVSVSTLDFISWKINVLIFCEILFSHPEMCPFFEVFISSKGK